MGGRRGDGGGAKFVSSCKQRCDVEQVSYKAQLSWLMLLRVRGRGNSSHAGNSVGVSTRSPLLPLSYLPLSLDEFYDPGLVFGWDDKDYNYDIGKDLQGWGKEGGKDDNNINCIGRGRLGTKL
jgi:hypothetical protein